MKRIIVTCLCLLMLQSSIQQPKAELVTAVVMVSTAFCAAGLILYVHLHAGKATLYLVELQGSVDGGKHWESLQQDVMELTPEQRPTALYTPLADGYEGGVVKLFRVKVCEWDGGFWMAPPPSPGLLRARALEASVQP